MLRLPAAPPRACPPLARLAAPFLTTSIPGADAPRGALLREQLYFSSQRACFGAAFGEFLRGPGCIHESHCATRWEADSRALTAGAFWPAVPCSPASPAAVAAPTTGSAPG